MVDIIVYVRVFALCVSIVRRRCLVKRIFLLA
jgi:hypothetical protein